MAAVEPQLQTAAPSSMPVEWPSSFYGNEPLQWIDKVERFFCRFGIIDPYRVKIASSYFDGPVVPWFQELQQSGSVTSWASLKMAILVAAIRNSWPVSNTTEDAHELLEERPERDQDAEEMLEEVAAIDEPNQNNSDFQDCKQSVDNISKEKPDRDLVSENTKLDSEVERFGKENQVQQSAPNVAHNMFEEMPDRAPGIAALMTGKALIGLQGLLVSNAVGGGTESGLGSLPLACCYVEYGKKPKRGFTIYSSPQVISFLLTSLRWDVAQVFDGRSAQGGGYLAPKWFYGINGLNSQYVMDMNGGFGGFVTALFHRSLCVMNVVPLHVPDTLPIIFAKRLIAESPTIRATGSMVLQSVNSTNRSVFNTCMTILQNFYISPGYADELLGVTGSSSGFNVAMVGFFFAVESVMWSSSSDSFLALANSTSMMILSSKLESVISEVGLGSDSAFLAPTYAFRYPRELPLYFLLRISCGLVSLTLYICTTFVVEVVENVHKAARIFLEAYKIKIISLVMKGDNQIPEILLSVQFFLADVDAAIMQNEFKRIVQVHVQGAAPSFASLPLFLFDIFSFTPIGRLAAINLVSTIHTQVGKLEETMTLLDKMHVQSFGEQPALMSGYIQLIRMNDAHKFSECNPLPDGTTVQVNATANSLKAGEESLEHNTEDDWEILELDSALTGEVIVQQLVPRTAVIGAPTQHQDRVIGFQPSHSQILIREQVISTALIHVQAENRKHVHCFYFKGVELGVVLASVGFIHPDTATSLLFDNFQLVTILFSLPDMINGMVEGDLSAKIIAQIMEVEGEDIAELESRDAGCFKSGSDNAAVFDSEDALIRLDDLQPRYLVRFVIGTFMQKFSTGLSPKDLIKVFATQSIASPDVWVMLVPARPPPAPDDVRSYVLANCHLLHSAQPELLRVLLSAGWPWFVAWKLPPPPNLTWLQHQFNVQDLEDKVLICGEGNVTYPDVADCLEIGTMKGSRSQGREGIIKGNTRHDQQTLKIKEYLGLNLVR